MQSKAQHSQAARRLGLRVRSLFECATKPLNIALVLRLGAAQVCSSSVPGTHTLHVVPQGQDDGHVLL